MTSCIFLTIKQLFRSATIKTRGIGTCPHKDISVQRLSPKSWALDIDINLTLIHFPCYEWLKLFFKKIEAPLISLLTLPLLSSSRPAQSPSLVTNFPTYRTVPSSISPRHFTWTRAPGLMLWKKTIDHIIILSLGKSSLSSTNRNHKQMQFAGETPYSILRSDWCNMKNRTLLSNQKWRKIWNTLPWLTPKS